MLGKFEEKQQKFSKSQKMYENKTRNFFIDKIIFESS
jgi:hypothetical protein